MSSIKSLRQPLSSALLLLSAGLLVFACEKEAAAPLQPRAPLSVQIVSGDLQSGPAGKELPNPLVVKVVDATGLPQSGQLVNFRVTSGGGSVFAGAALTSVTGIAQERWTLGTNPADSQRVEARAVDNVTGQALTFGVFRATIVVPSAPVAAVTVAPASAAVAVGGAVQLTATTKDAAGNVLTGRVVTWASGTPTVVTVSATGLVTGVSGGTATVTAISEGKTGSAAITVTVPVAAVTVTPASASVAVGGTVQLAATPKDASGNTLSGRVVTWASNTVAVASVNGSGLVKGLVAGSATITATSEGKSGSSVITVTAPTVVSCLTSPTITLSGVQTSAFANTSLPDNTQIDASTAQFLTSDNISIRFGGGSNTCYHGGETIGNLPPATSWSSALSHYSMVPDGPNVTVENVRTFDRGDGVAFGKNVPNWTLRASYIHYARDGCVENHFVFSGTIDDALLDGCFIGFASRPYTTAQDGSNNVMTIKNTLVRLQPMDGVFTGPLPGHGGFYEWSATSPMLSLHNDVFRVDQNLSDHDEFLAPPPGKLADCANNVMIWLGPGPFPETLPSCFTVMTGAAGLQYWNNAVAQWKANHPNLLPDVGPPVISLFAPSDGATLTGTVSLTATAVDDRDMAGVQFQLDGQNVGPEVTTDSPITKFTLSWDSHGMANGTYTLTATARDAAGHTTTSAGITITVSN
ncbi:MAG TPA: Ig-like domain-containing protein [Gemmatimonadales bacterium]|nr:Ig-like domain-containing protein [Gemmatimonadales bacterium]